MAGRPKASQNPAAREAAARQEREQRAVLHTDHRDAHGVVVQARAREVGGGTEPGAVARQVAARPQHRRPVVRVGVEPGAERVQPAQDLTVAAQQAGHHDDEEHEHDGLDHDQSSHPRRLRARRVSVGNVSSTAATNHAQQPTRSTNATRPEVAADRGQR